PDCRRPDEGRVAPGHAVPRADRNAARPRRRPGAARRGVHHAEWTGRVSRSLRRPRGGAADPRAPVDRNDPGALGAVARRSSIACRAGGAVRSQMLRSGVALAVIIAAAAMRWSACSREAERVPVVTVARSSLRGVTTDGYLRAVNATPVTVPS